MYEVSNFDRMLNMQAIPILVDCFKFFLYKFGGIDVEISPRTFETALLRFLV